MSMPKLSYKDDKTFSKYLAMAYVGELGAVELMRVYGHDFLFDGYGAGSFDIYKDIQKKKKRTPDLICKNCRQKLEVRAKSKLRIAMSDSPGRRFDKELDSSDWVGFVQVVARKPVCGEMLDYTRPESYVAPSEIYVIPVSHLSVTREAAQSSGRKSPDKGSETYIEWPIMLSRHDGVIVGISRNPSFIDIKSNGGVVHRYVPSEGHYLYGRRRVGSQVMAFQSVLTGLVRPLMVKELVCSGVEP